MKVQEMQCLLKLIASIQGGNLSYLITLGFPAAESTFSVVSCRDGKGNHRGTFDVKEK